MGEPAEHRGGDGGKGPAAHGECHDGPGQQAARQGKDEHLQVGEQQRRGDDLDEHEEEARFRAQALECHEDYDVAQAQLHAGHGDGQGDE